MQQIKQFNHSHAAISSSSRLHLDEQPADNSRLANDIHSKLNSTRHREIVKVSSAKQVQDLLTAKEYAGCSFCIAGGRHAMGGQQFLFDGILLDTSAFNRVVDFDPKRGLITVEAGILWGALVAELSDLNRIHGSCWSIIQKPTGADDISVGGSLSSNIHGRVLGRMPFIADIECFTAIMSDGNRINVSRNENKELFQLAIGGYGLFCFVENITVRLTGSRSLRRLVEFTNSAKLIDRFAQLQAEGATYGDFQFCIDSGAKTFLNNGILSAYFPVVGHGIKSNTGNLELGERNWRELLRLAHVDKTEAFKMYSDHYKRTNGQIYSSETFQLSLYVPDYHDGLEKHNGVSASEMISELYVPRLRLHEFLDAAASSLKQQRADVIYGTVRLIERDTESFLAWAKNDFACIIFNLHVEHDQVSILRAKHSFRTLIEIALSMGGSYYLTYHRYATKRQIMEAYPQVEAFIRKKADYDPHNRFRSTWFSQLCRSLKSK